ncbi:MAG TPA: response regulator [Desulfobacteraceae bacterium]|nr:response regulator [Deltaproteobacteria bacterium]MBW2355928.1 response regulator [Deltaproteobacteria bacterium]RLB98489.1 MAG: response regulator [Deltaproteobacteria bacterium]HDI59790.1 response regulator [Desulfobacteraceae bacterium]
MPSSKPSEPFIRLLLIDDETVFVEVLAKRLSRRGIEVEKAYSGGQGIQLLRKQDFDVALLDLKMVDMDGMEVLRVLKLVAPDLPVILISGHGADDAARQGQAAGAFDFLAKPCDLDLLIEKIHAAVGRGGGG